MEEPSAGLGDWERTHDCGTLTDKDIGQRVLLMGWVWRRRDHGGVIFIDLRDRYGITQIVFNPQRDPTAYHQANHLRSEYVIAVQGEVEARPKGMVNPQLPTGAIEVNCDQLRLLNRCQTPPFLIEDQTDAGEEIRLKYRYLDLRRPRIQGNLLLRHRGYQIVRRLLDERGFIEIETPLLTKSTPEGARDYLVPSRVHPGQFFALPQSPQTYKQLLMIAGYDRYFQIVKCFRRRRFTRRPPARIHPNRHRDGLRTREPRHGHRRGSDPHPRSLSYAKSIYPIPFRNSPIAKPWSASAPTNPTCALD